MAHPAFDIAETAARLRDSLSTLKWALAMIPEQYTHKLPDYYPPDAWSAAMNVAHMIIYEDKIANPVLAAIAKGGDGVGATRSPMEDWFHDDAQTLAQNSVSALYEQLRAVREDGVALVNSFSVARFNEPATPLWSSGRHGNSPHSASWVANKTFQHTWEHGNAVLRLALFAPRD